MNARVATLIDVPQQTPGAGEQAVRNEEHTTCDVWLSIVGSGRTLAEVSSVLGIDCSEGISSEGPERKDGRYVWRRLFPASVPAEIDNALGRTLSGLDLPDLKQRIDSLEPAEAIIEVGVFMGTDRTRFDHFGLAPETVALLAQSGLRLACSIYP